MKIWDFASDILDFKQQTCGGKIAAMVRERQQTWRFQGVEIGISSTPMVVGLS